MDKTLSQSILETSQNPNSIGEMLMEKFFRDGAAQKLPDTIGPDKVVYSHYFLDDIRYVSSNYEQTIIQDFVFPDGRTLVNFDAANKEWEFIN